MSCRLRALHQRDRLPWSVCPKNNTILTHSGVHLKGSSDELYTSVYFSVVSQIGINNAHIVYLQLQSMCLENVTFQLQEVNFSGFLSWIDFIFM